MTLQTIIGNPSLFLDCAFKQLTESSIDVSQWELDHICYRTATNEEYQAAKKALLKLGILIGENQVKGRPIAVFQLHNPIIYQERTINILELPAPKLGSTTESGLEHIEFVIDCSFQAFLDRYPHIAFDQSNRLRPINPDLKLSFPELQVKFHRTSLVEVLKHSQEAV